MEHINKVLENLPEQSNSRSKPSNTEDRSKIKARAEFMSYVWEELQYKKLVHDPIGSGAYNSFCRDLLDKTENDIRIGLHRVRNHTGFFNTPIFRELCKPDMESFGLPSVEKAYHEACNVTFPAKAHRWSHTAVFHAGADVGWFDLRQNANNPWNRFRQAYKQRCEQVFNSTLPPMPKHESLPEKPQGRKLEGEELDRVRNNLKNVLGD